MSLISQAAKRLKTLLATTAGAAQVGFDAGLAYAAGTVGAVLKSLQNSITTMSGQIAGILDGADFTGPVKLPGNASDNLHAVPLQQVNAIAEAAAGLAATGVEVGRLLRVERFTASGTFTKQPGDRLIDALLIGGGGAGNGYEGGGAGATARKMFDAADLNANTAVTVGGSNQSTVFATVTAGAGEQTGGNAGRGGLGGIATGGDININGGAGGAGGLAGSGGHIYGQGGASSMGGAGAGGYTFAQNHAAARPGQANTGGGGSGAGEGGSGYVEIRVYS